MLQQIGLTSTEAKKRLITYGSNELRRYNKVSPLKIFLSQFTSPLIIILIVAAIVSLVIGFFPGQNSNIFDTSLIFLIVFMSGIAGFIQEYKSEKTIEALKNMSVLKTRVIRDGEEQEIKSTEIVPGDLIVLESGDAIPADAKIIECFGLEIDESVLTGESRGIRKNLDDSIFMNTFVSSGSAKAIVMKTGMQTKVGSIATKLQEMTDEETSFQTELSKFSKIISIVIIAIIVVIVFVSLLKYNLYLSLLLAISLAVAAIPEGLPAVVVLTLSAAGKVLSKKNALIRRLSVTESIGAVDIICTDKTGTLTKNEMTVSKLFFNNKVLDQELSKEEVDNMKPLLVCGALCNNSKMGLDEKGQKKYLGDQTEVALRKISDRYGITKEDLEKEYTKVNELAFLSTRKMMSVVYKFKNKYFVYSKGAPEILIENCDKIYENGKITKLSSELKTKILKQNKEFASKALRVIGLAFKETQNSEKDLETGLVWLGLQAMIDPPRPEVIEAIKDCKTAGIRVIMLTGDSPITAKAIADGIGLESAGALEGKDLDKITDEELNNKLNSGINIFARISPFHKLRVLEILKKHSRVLMTGDGVNDALALKKADVGVAMGIKGTEVAKEASDMILLDDNFATIIEGVKEGRRAFDNIRKFVNYLFVCNFAEVGVLLLATLFLALAAPILLPVHLLWINLITDGLPALALGVDPARADIMQKKPRKKGEPIINKSLGWLIGLIGLEKIIILFATFFLLLPMGLEVARTGLFTAFILYEFVRIASIRYQEKLGWFSNKLLLIALAVSLLLQIIIIYSPIGKFFHVVPLVWYVWVVLICGTFIGYVGAILITNIVQKYITKEEI